MFLRYIYQRRFEGNMKRHLGPAKMSGKNRSDTAVRAIEYGNRPLAIELPQEDQTKQKVEEFLASIPSTPDSPPPEYEDITIEDIETTPKIPLQFPPEYQVVQCGH